MESPKLPEATGSKRKRSPVDESSSARPTAPLAAPATAVAGSVPQINYLIKTRADKLGLIEGDAETFGDVLGIIDEYEGVLQRHESLAANLGAKLVGPMLLKSFEKLFDGPIKIINPMAGFEQSVGWLDIVNYARSNPSEFTLNEFSPGIMSCRVWIKGVQIEVSEDDFRLIMSGAPERVIPSQPIAEDEVAELGTLNILEARLAVLIKKADTVASRARQLNYHLKGRKTAVLGRRTSDQPQAIIDTPQESRTFSPQPYPSMTQPPNIANGDPAKMQQQLLEQFLSGERRHPATPTAGAKPLRSSEPAGRAESQNRVIMHAKMNWMARGEVIYPPCDRCRRLGFECAKNLTACSACTKKHAKCSWNDIKNGELDNIAAGPPPGALQQQRRGSSVNGAGISPTEGQMGQTDLGHRDIPPSMHGLPNVSHFSPENPPSPHIADNMNHDRRSSNLSNDHGTLTQIASAAAAVGNR